MRRLLLSFVIFLISMTAFAQLEVKENSFREVPGFVNINPDDNYQTDDNDLPFAVIKVRTENINDKQRRELTFSGNAGTFIVLEYKDGEVWVYLTAKYADYLKISHPDFSSIEFTLPFDLEPKKGYEMTLVNKPAVDEEIQKKLERLEELEKGPANVEKQEVASQQIVTYKTHIVKKGESLLSIAQKYDCTVEDIMRWNDMKSNKLKLGQKLKIKE